MFDVSTLFGKAACALLVSAALHILVIIISGGGYVAAMIGGALLWVICAFLLRTSNRWIAGLVFFLAIFAAATLPLAYGLSETGLTAMAFLGIVAANLITATLLFIALWRAKGEPQVA